MFSLVASVIQRTGLVGVFLLMLAENLAPLIPSELIMPMAGFAAARGAMDPVAAVLVGRALPGVRGVICIPAGVARMPFGPFLLWSSVGATLWSALLVAAGYLLKAQYARVGHWLNPVADVFLGTCLALYVFRLARYRPARSQP